MQKQLIFWTPETRPDDFVLREWVRPGNPDSPFNRFVGNGKALLRLARAAYHAMQKPNHVCKKNFALFGPSSAGKTTLARIFAEVLGLPFVELSPDSLDTMQDIYIETASVLKETKLEVNGKTESLELVEQQDGSYILPPMVIFIDEVHALKAKKRLSSGLLKAIALNDRVMRTEKGVRINMEKVCWIIATTERDDVAEMFSGAFINRFKQIILRLYSKAEIAQIVHQSHPDWSPQVCKLVARLVPAVPREALDFANDMHEQHAMCPQDWETVAKLVAHQNGIDELGMTYQRVEVLRLLGRGPVSKDQLASLVGVGEKELRTLVMPPLQAITPDQQMPLVTVSSRGYAITPAGLVELDNRQIKHLGVKAIPQQSRDVLAVFNHCEVPGGLLN